MANSYFNSIPKQMLHTIGIPADADDELALNLVAEYYNIPRLDPDAFHWQEDVVARFNSLYLGEQNFFPIALDEQAAMAIISYPWQRTIDAEIHRICPTIKHIHKFLSYPEKIRQALQKISGSRKLGTFFSQDDDEDDHEILRLQPDENTPFGELSRLFSTCIADGASDLHFQMEGDLVLARAEIGGMVRELGRYPYSHGAALVRSILTKASITEEKLYSAVDGSKSVMTKDGIRIDLRIAVLPTYSADDKQCFHSTFRFQNSSRVKDIDLKGLFSGQTLMDISRAINAPGGICFFSGPTGSGKTTTLGACLKDLNKPTRTIYTLEDPPENIIPGIASVQIRNHREETATTLTFAQAFKALLRKKPHIILIGEIRDSEVASLALEAALTGHGVLTTVHADRASDVPERLFNMGVETAKMASKIRLCSSQRLYSKLCPHCSLPHRISQNEASLYGIPLPLIESGNLRRRNEKGCNQCNRGVLRSPIPIIEILHFDSEVRDLLCRSGGANGWSSFKKLAKEKLGDMSLPKQTLQLLNQGIIDIEGVNQVLSLHDDHDI